MILYSLPIHFLLPIDGDELKTYLEEAESCIEDLRRYVLKNDTLAPVLSHLLIGVGRALPKSQRPDDAIALLRDAVEFARQRYVITTEKIHLNPNLF